MKPYHRKFIIWLFILSLLVYGILQFLSPRLSLPAQAIAAMVALLFVINSLAFIFVTNTKDRNPRGFVSAYMIVSLGRLLICAAFVFLYALTHRPFAKPFAVSFFVLYFIYTIVEVRAIYAFFKA